MACSKKAVQNTKDRMLIAGATTLLYGWLAKDLRSDSLLNNFWQISKNWLKKDEKARTDLITTVLCKLGL